MESFGTSRISKSFLVTKSKILNEIKSHKNTSKLSYKQLEMKTRQLEEQTLSLQHILQEKQSLIQSQQTQIEGLLQSLQTANQSYTNLQSQMQNLESGFRSLKNDILSLPSKITIINSSATPIKQQEEKNRPKRRPKKFSKYEKMLIAGVPDGAVRLKLLQDGLSAEEFFNFNPNNETDKGERKKPTSKSKSASVEKPNVTMSALLGQIQAGKSLKKIEKRSKPEDISPQKKPVGGGGMLAELAKKAKDRSSRSSEVAEALRKKSIERGNMRKVKKQNATLENDELLKALEKRKI
eukprot:snap_masked-scaffold_4-processed-gene-18.35-mRNA-1 protein AED:1.00 eAED:1.00 QI:0/-1/0/0/-1/1/1/0/294